MKKRLLKITAENQFQNIECSILNLRDEAGQLTREANWLSQALVHGEKWVPYTKAKRPDRRVVLIRPRGLREYPMAAEWLEEIEPVGLYFPIPEKWLKRLEVWL